MVLSNTNILLLHNNKDNSVTKEKRLIQRLKKAIAEVNECSNLLAKDNIYANIKHLGREESGGEQIELHDVLLFKSLLKEKSPLKENHDSK